MQTVQLHVILPDLPVGGICKALAAAGPAPAHQSMPPAGIDAICTQTLWLGCELR